ncbi:MAG: stage 0 sporulation protein [Lentisphaeria bacterium]|nr:stage 0 sporulation protein [Lentisphaeria bacterium]
MELFYEILLDNGAKYRARGDDSQNLKLGDYCVIRKDFYQDYGQVCKVYGVGGAPVPPPTPEKGPDWKTGEIPGIIRKATVVDMGKANENQMRSKGTLRTTQLHIDRLNLPMKLINAHHSFDGKLIQIQFSAEGRVDFRELVKVLSQEFNTRIELRQIGVRDETAIVGGIAMCGRPLCCCLYMRDFPSINVKMAKEQDLSLTPGTISGVCGRLKCCLKYEHEGYLELEKNMPRRGDFCECKEGFGRVTDRNLLTRKVVIQLEDSQRTVTCSGDDVRVTYPEKYKLRDGGQKDGKPSPSGEGAPRGNEGGGKNSQNPHRDRDRDRRKGEGQNAPRQEKGKGKES